MLLEKKFIFKTATKHFNCVLFLYIPYSVNRTLLIRDKRGPQVVESSSCRLYNCFQDTPQVTQPTLSYYVP